MATSLQDLTKQQRANLEEFTKKVSDVLQPDHIDEELVKWLKAYKFNVRKAETKFRQSLDWRKKMGADNIIDTWNMPEVLKEHNSKLIVGHDKEGCPFAIVPSGRYDVKGTLKSITKEDEVLGVIYRLEKVRKDMKEQSEKLGRNISQMTEIVDLEGLDIKIALWKKSREYSVMASRLMTDNYPEFVKKILIINAPSFFPYAYSLVKPLISKKIQKKIVIFGPDKSKWVPALLEVIDPSQLPKHWGGDCVDPDGDPMCPSKVFLGGEVPKSFYLANAALTTDAELEFKTVEKGQALDMEFNVAIADSKLLWVFYLDKSDEKIGFVVRHQSPTGMKDVVTYSREKRDSVVNGELVCSSTGKYVVTFDNTKGKKSVSLWCSVEVILPQNDTEEHSD